MIDELFGKHAEDIWASCGAVADVLESANFIQDVSRLLIIHSKDDAELGRLIRQRAETLVDNEAGYRARCEQTGEEI